MNALLQILSGGAVGAVLVTIANGLFSKRKLSAEATKIITDAAAGVAAELRIDNASARREAQEARAEVVQLRASVRQLEAITTVHSFWDSQAYEALKEQGIDMPPPPPLYPQDTSRAGS